MGALDIWTYDDWLRYRNQRFAEYPANAQHLRLDIELSFPRERMSMIPVFGNPHHYPYTDPHETFYVCDDWVLISPVVIISNAPHPFPTLRMLVESSHPEGDRIRLMSTSCSIVHEWWADYKNWSDFAYYRGTYWKITWNEFFGEWPGGKWRGLPFQDRRHLDDRRVA